MAECSIGGCGGTALARGWCRPHYRRWQRHGAPEAGGATRNGFWSHVDKSATCWVWTGTKDRNGYGIASRGPGGVYSKYAHRQSYQRLVGDIPEGLSLDHLCRTTSCVRPDHLEPVTHTENVRRGLHGRPRTHCPHGHPYDAENSHVGPDGRVYCRSCNREASRRYRERKTRS